MFVIYNEIRLDPSATTIVVCETEWAINPREHCMQHEPTMTVFRIGLDEKPTESASLSPMDFSARLVAILDGYALPAPATIESLGRAAIVLYLAALGLVRRTPVADPKLPGSADHVHMC